ncbi:MAG: hypothetical protein C0408_09535 [Odoribacter sp.]|nr:hypothetical protein [Odoribacter sp.]
MKDHKNILLIQVVIITLIIGNSCHYSNTAGAEKPQDQVISTDTADISFRVYEHEFGKISEGEKVACIFTFENTGKGPLVISSVTSSCGCTVPKYDTKPISPGSTGIVEVVFDSSGRYGRQTKTITVISNALKSIVLLRISGEIITSTNN